MLEEVRACDIGQHSVTQLAGVKILSLDCFDTILWRKTAAPTDVFYGLANSPAYRRHGLTAQLRASAEMKARRTKYVETGRSEVNLTEIYRHALPCASVEAIGSLESAEIEAEIEYCHVYEPVYELIKAAKAAGMQVVVVSDTYLKQAQLQHLLFSIRPELESLIDQIFCSNEYGLSKAQGIWPAVLAKLSAQPVQIMHIGDNPLADLHPPRKYGLQSIHLVQFDREVEAMLEARVQAAVQALPQVRNTAPLPSLSHAQLAAFSAMPDPYINFGYRSLGPIMQSFADFIVAEVAQMELSGRKPKVGFLMRDGYLPSQCVEVVLGNALGASLNISRFTSIAASLSSKERIASVLADSIAPDTLDAVAKQLLLPQKLADRIVTAAKRVGDPVRSFCQQVLADDIVKFIIASGLKFRQRLVRHIQKRTGVQAGDTLVFVDLGYYGTAQNLLKDIVREELGANLVGRYLISAKQSSVEDERRGLVDPSWADARIAGALTGQYIATFEMLCTQNAPSTIDYTEDGEPVFASNSINPVQSDIVTKIQDGCLAYIGDTAVQTATVRTEYDYETASLSVVIDLARLLYFPTLSELECLAGFQFDVNLGTDKHLELFDMDAAQLELRRFGLAYMNASLDTLRTHYPAELRFVDMSLSCTLFAQNRYGFPINQANRAYRQESVLIHMLSASGGETVEAQAALTQDGYFAVFVPLKASCDVALNLGRNYKFVQIDAIRSVDDLKRPMLGEDLIVGADCQVDDISILENGLCEVGPNGMIMFNAATASKARCALVVFRPIVNRHNSN